MVPFAKKDLAILIVLSCPVSQGLQLELAGIFSTKCRFIKICCLSKLKYSVETYWF